MEITLTKSQAAFMEKLTERCKRVEAILSTPVSVNDPEALLKELSSRIEALSLTSTLLADATLLYDYAKGSAVTLILEDEKLTGAKQDVLRLYIQGKLAKYNAIYVRAETLVKDLRNSVDGIRSLLSYEREMVRNGVTDSFNSNN